MSSVNKIFLWIRICNFISYTVMYRFVEFESLKKWLVLPLPTWRFLTFAYIQLPWMTECGHWCLLVPDDVASIQCPCNWSPKNVKWEWFQMNAWQKVTPFSDSNVHSSSLQTVSCDHLGNGQNHVNKRRPSWKEKNHVNWRR